MVTKLLVFKGFTVDFRLREFRKAIPEKCLEFVAFDSSKGRKLLAEMSNQRKENQWLIPRS
ncbi:MAG: hypothetical protein WCI77_01060 [Candidatus Omnitrophota bacterium]